jgi:hypothetical protein
MAKFAVPGPDRWVPRGRCKKHLEFLTWFHPSKAVAMPVIPRDHDHAKTDLFTQAQVGPFRQSLAD